MRYLRPIGLFAVISSGILMILGSATTPTRHPMADEFQRTIPKCFNDRECERKWAAAQAWIVKRAAYKIQVATSSLIETYNPPSGSTGIAARVVKEPISDNGYQFIVSVWCGNVFGCQPDNWDAAIDFNRTINAVVTAQGAQPSAAPPAPTPARMDTNVFRQCVQTALLKLGIWDGPADGENSPRWEAVWGRYLDSHVELSHDQRQAPIRMVIDGELAAIHERINWEACTS